MTSKELKRRVLHISSQDDFESLALDIFQYQAEHNEVYKAYLKLLKKQPDTIKTLSDIPFLPISFFKYHKITSCKKIPDFYFQSSGTTGMQRSYHYVEDVDWYYRNAGHIFSQFYGDVESFCFLALLPSYLEQQHSSLVAMVNHFMSESACAKNSFFLNEYDQLAKTIETIQQPTVLLGVSYALMDFADYYNKSLPEQIIVMETGGMKGRRKEMQKTELHNYLSTKFHTIIHSEYGMAELTSQAYAPKDGIFRLPAQMRLFIRDRYDPFSFLPYGKTGGVNIIDLANVDSCSFIETEDLGRMHDDRHFELFGRLEETDIRGCNLLVEE